MVTGTPAGEVHLVQSAARRFCQPSEPETRPALRVKGQQKICAADDTDNIAVSDDGKPLHTMTLDQLDDFVHGRFHADAYGTSPAFIAISRSASLSPQQSSFRRYHDNKRPQLSTASRNQATSNVKATAEQGDYGQHRGQRIGDKASAEIAAAWRTA